jgi:AcrR family transcriptional regulator
VTLSDGRAARREQSRTRIVEAATALFADNGFAATSVDDVAAAAGVSKGTVFYGFTSKDALFVVVMEGVVERVVELMTQARSGLCGWSALERQTMAVLEAVDRSAPVGRLLVTQLYGPSGPWDEGRGTSRARLLAPLIDSLAEIRAERGVGAAQGEDTVAVALLGALVFAALDRLAYPQRSLAEVHTRLLQVITGLRGAASGED